MHALILAAGEGSRLGLPVPKCLVEVGGRPLLHHQLDALEDAGAEQITLVVGHRREQVRAAAGDRARLVVNERFADTNSLYSFWLARQAVAGEVLLLNSDVLFPAELLSRLLTGTGSALAYDSSSGGDAEHMKVHLRWGSLHRMSKQLPADDIDGENVGVLRLSAPAASAAFEAAGRRLAAGSHGDWVGTAISDVADRHSITCRDVADLPWVEIDFPEDLDRARDDVWPAIAALQSPFPTIDLNRARTPQTAGGAAR